MIKNDLVNLVNERIKNKDERKRYSEYIKEIYLGDKTDIREICCDIFETMKNEKRYREYPDDISMFRDWCMGLPNLIYVPYVYDDMKKELASLLDIEVSDIILSGCSDLNKIEIAYFTIIYHYIDKLSK